MGAGAMVQLVCNLAAGMIISYSNPALSWGVGIGVGLAFGLLNSFLVVYLHIPTFVTTLGTMYVMNGISALYNGGTALAIKETAGFTVLTQGSILGIPNIFLLVVLLCGIMQCFFKYTRTGLRMYACGENRNAAELHGLNVGKYLILGYLISC